MKALKVLLILTLFFVSIVFTFNKPGARPLESFISLSEKNASFSQTLLKYPPGIYFIYNTLLEKFPPNRETPLVNQSIWTAWKLISLISYLLTWFALLYISKRKNASDRLDTTLFFFGSASFTLINLSLGLFEAFAVTPFILSLHFLFKKRLIPTTLFYFAAVFLNWYLLTLSPFYLVYILKNYPRPKVFPVRVIYFVFPLLICIYLSRLSFHQNGR